MKIHLKPEGKMKIAVENEIEGRSAERRHFLSYISHGIRTPLNSIMGFSKLLVQRDVNRLDQREYAKRIVQSSNVLLHFLENLIDLSQLESSDIVYKEEPVNLNQLLWDFSQKFGESVDSDLEKPIKVILVWDVDIQDFTILTDGELLTKALSLIIKSFGLKKHVDTVEVGFKISDADQIKFIINPILNRGENNEGLENYSPYNFDKSISNMNIELVNKIINMMGGRLIMDNQESNASYLFSIPLKFPHQERTACR